MTMQYSVKWATLCYKMSCLNLKTDLILIGCQMTKELLVSFFSILFEYNENNRVKTISFLHSKIIFISCRHYILSSLYCIS